MRHYQIKHGTLGTYEKRGCRCDACRQANIEASRRERRARGMPEMGNPCRRGGTIFRTQAEAARALGVSSNTVSNHLMRHGNLDRIGSSGLRPLRCKPVRVGAREWPSRVALDRHLGLPRGTVSGWLCEGRLDALLGAVMRAEAQSRIAA